MSDDASLWISDSGRGTAAIEVGVLAARESLAKAGVSAKQGLIANLARADGHAYDEAHADAWDEAERMALIACDAGPFGCLTAG